MGATIFRRQDTGWSAGGTASPLRRHGGLPGRRTGIARTATGRTETGRTGLGRKLRVRRVARWAKAHLGRLKHERRVARIAGVLFDLTRDLHGLPDAARDLLRAAAFAHDVGRAVHKPDHPRIGAEMLLADPALRAGRAARRALAFLTLYHRDDVPRPGREAVLRPGDDAPGLRVLLALLRAADALDSRSLESPHLVFERRKRRLDIACHLDHPSRRVRRAYSRRKKFRLLEEELSCEIRVEVRPA